MSRVIVVTSGKGGVGKTTITANLGKTLSSHAIKTVLIDTDFGLNNLDVALNVEHKVIYDVIDVVQNRCAPRQALINSEDYPYLFVMPGARFSKNNTITGQNLRAIVNQLKTYFDYVIIDCPAGIDYGFHRAVQSADEAIVVVTPHVSAVRDADKVISILKSYQLNDVRVVVNRARGDLVMAYENLDPKEIAEILNVSLLGIVPDDDYLNTGLGQSRVAIDCFNILVDNLHNGSSTMYDITHKYKGFWGNIKRNLRRIV